MTKIKHWLTAAGAILVLVLGILFKRRGEKISVLEAEVTSSKLANDTAALKERANASTEGYKNALEEYNRLKRLHSPSGTSGGSSSDSKQ